jgi:NAD+ diphosphatase
MRTWFLVHPKGVVLRREGEGYALPTEEEALALGVDERDAHVLGEHDGASALACAVPKDAFVPPPLAIVDPFELRRAYGSLGEERFRLVGAAMQLVHWADTHGFCGRCASPTGRASGERAMRCPRCGLLAYPRISPAVIVLVRRGEEALLARNARFPLPFYSTLAGFVEVGETLEETVVREIREEAGITVGNLRYFGSQPWPFPHSLMIAFVADYISGELAADPTELADAQWFRASALPMVPPRMSIARAMIDAWVAEAGG